MQSFVFHNPVKLIFGEQSLSQLAKEITGLGDRVLFVYGQGSIRKNLIYDSIVNTLHDNSIDFIEHGDIQANPLLSHVHSGIDTARKHDRTVILGVGGGSVMDSAKAIAAGVPAPHDVWKFFSGRKSVKHALPVVCVPTTAGSGSEMNSGMVLTNDELRLKLGFGHRLLFPRVSLVDPSLMFSVPREQTVFGAVDALVHCLEIYLSAEYFAPLQFRFLESIGKTIIETTEQLLQDPLSYDNRATMVWASSLALSGFIFSGLGRLQFGIHVLEHGVSATFSTPHGAGLAALLSGWLLSERSRLQERLARFGRYVFAIETTDEDTGAELTISQLQSFLKSIDCPLNLSELGVRPEHIPDLTEHSLKQAKIWRIKNYDRKKITGILNNCLASPGR